VTLSTRLWVLGAALPVVVLAGVLVMADQLFHLALTTSLDRALLAQAAVESVSLFDGPASTPHLHMSRSPLVDSVQPFAPEGVLFGPDGVELVRYPPVTTTTPEIEAPGVPGEPPVLTTVEVRGVNVRRISVAVSDEHGRPYGLRLSASMALLDASTKTFHWVGALSTLAAAAALVLVQLWQGRQLRVRLAGLREHLEAVRGGDLDRQLTPETAADELSELREVLGGATAALKEARLTQERLLADAAHELRTPLTLMRTSLDLALRRERSPAELKAALQDTREEVDRLTTLASRLLDTVAGGKTPLERAPTNLSALALLVADAVRAVASERELTVRLDAPDTATALVHAGSIRQAFDNLLSNALKFAPRQSTVVVRVARQASAWLLSVADEGPGIPPEAREAMFEPFHRARGPSQGAGLGLTIVREVARRHGGRAYIADVPHGTLVCIELPDTPAPS
jgi:signal transduction histidine kinase